MLCQECGSKPATVHMTKIVNNDKQEYHLCAECASSKEGFELTHQPEFSFHNLLTGLVKDLDITSPQLGYQKTIDCDRCGIDFRTFQQEGFLSCGDCYYEFEERLEPVLKKIHGHQKHVGKVPKRSGNRLQMKRQIEELKQNLEAAIEKEEYEQAAELRDRIHDLEEELG